MDQKQQIEVRKGGPYVVKGAIPLKRETAETDFVFPIRWKEEKGFPPRQQYTLCRCGASDEKPFCDGKHSEIGFDGTETATNKPYNERAERFEGPGVDLLDVKDLCSGARFCDRAGGTWKLTENSADPHARQTAIQQSCDCPSGRLVACEKGNGQPIEPPFEKAISVTQDPGANVSGPLWVKGGIPVVSADGETYEIRNRVTLCRCGESKNKPFCDATHIAAKFDDGEKEGE